MVTGKARMSSVDAAEVEGYVTVHPSSLLRAPDAASRAREYARFVSDMKAIARHIPDIRA